MRRKDERGAVTLTVALTMTALMGVASLALDIGMQRVGVRDMQALADVVALDMARHLDGRTAGVIDADPAWDQALAESIARNDDTFGDTPDVTTELGEMDTVTREFETVSSGEVPTAVRVISTSSVNYVLRTGEGAVVRDAVGRASKSACFRLGSFAVDLDSQKSAILNALIGDALNAGVLGYSGLATSSIELGDLAVALGVGTVHELAAADVSMSALLDATIAVLTQQSGDPTAAADIALLQTIRAATAITTAVDLGSLLTIGEGATSAAEAQINVLDLVAGAAFIANGDAALSLPATTVTLPGLTNVVIAVKVVEAPRLACGVVDSPDAVARTAQLQLDVTGKMLGVNLGVAKASLDVNLTLDVAHATGRLTDATCGAGTPTSPMGVDVEVADGLTDLELRLPTRIHTGGLIDVNLLKLDVVLATNPPATTQTAHVVIDSPDDWETGVQTGSGNIGLQGLAITTANVNVLSLGLSLGAVLGPLTTIVVNPLVAVLDSALLTPLTELLGVNLSGADVFLARPEPDCSSPRLVS